MPLRSNNSYRDLKKNCDGVSFERYKLAKKTAKKAVYEKLDTKQVEKDIYRIFRIRERKTRDLCTVRCVKDEDQKILVRDKEIEERWREYFDKCSMVVLLKTWMTLPFSTKI